MNFQIMNIVLYGKKGERESIEFNLGDLNIITGVSGTGKTALLEIIDYCLCSDSCNIPGGVMRKSLEWVGIRLKTKNGEIFVARRMPETGFNTSERVYYDFSKKISIPENSELQQNENVDSLKNLLSEQLGIEENIHEPPKGQTRPPLKANIKHSMAFTLQHQNEIDHSRLLFHNQWKPFVPQAIKDTLPYFLGAVNKDYIAKKAQLRLLNKELRSLKRKLDELESIKGEGITRAQTLLKEAENLGFEVEIYNNLFDNARALREIQKMPVFKEDEGIDGSDVFEKLQEERNTLKEEYTIINAQIKEVDTVFSERRQYSEEVIAQINRLKSIELFGEHKNLKSSCPLCESDISNKQLPKVTDIKNSIKKLEFQLPSRETPSPQIQKAIRNLKIRLNGIKTQLRENLDEIKELTRSNERIKEFRDFNEQKAYLFGKIDLYLESLPNIYDNRSLKEDIIILEDQITDLKNEISDEKIKERLESILFIISKYMGEFATELGLEHSKYPLHLDLENLTVIADTPEEPLPLKIIGSGQNWVGYHLITLFALHKWFVEMDRPVPQFLFIDQPSKGHFPADDEDENMETAKNEDIETVKKIYEFTYNFVQKLHPNFQIIATDHAYFKNEEWFTSRVIKRWRTEGLIPESWYNNDQ
jgi:hypothetical protein